MISSHRYPTDFASYTLQLFDQEVCFEFRSVPNQALVEARVFQDRNLLWPSEGPCAPLSFVETPFEFLLKKGEEITGGFTLVESREQAVRVHTLVFSHSGQRKHFEGFIGNLIYTDGSEPGPSPMPIPPPHPPSPLQNPFPEVWLENQAFQDLFHFTGLHQPSRIPRSNRQRFIPTTTASQFQQSLFEAAQKNDPAKIQSLATDHLQTQEFQDLISFLNRFSFSLIETYEWLRVLMELPEALEMWECSCHWDSQLEQETDLLPWLILSQRIAKDAYLALLIRSLDDDNRIESITQLTLWLRLLEYFIRFYQQSSFANTHQALSAVIVLPNVLFSVLLEGETAKAQALVAPLGIADLMLVREHLSRYELGEIAHIENVMPHSQKIHSRREGERVQGFRDEVAHEEDQHRSTERNLNGHGISRGNPVAHKKTFAFDQEDGLLKEYENENNKSLERLSGGWSLLYDPEEGSLSQALQYVQDRLAQFDQFQNRQVLKRRALNHQQEWEHLERTVIDNQNHSLPVQGIYRWVNRIKKNELVNLGHRLLIRFNVPEPGKGLFNPPVIGQLPPGLEQLLSELEGFRKLDRKSYLLFASGLGIQELLLPPAPEKSLGIQLSNSPPILQRQVELPSGYMAVSAQVTVVYDGSRISGAIGQKTLDQSLFNCSDSTSIEANFPAPPPLLPEKPVACGLQSPPLELNKEQGTISVSMLSNANFFQANIVLQLKLVPNYYEAWQIQAGLQLKNAFAEFNRDPLRKIQLVRLHADQKELQRKTLKQRSLWILFQEMASVEPFFQHYFNLPEAIAAFNWEDLYFAFRLSEEETESASEKPTKSHDQKPPEWFDSNQGQPHFNEFLKADLAKVFVTVKPGYELLVLYAIWSRGLTWTGLKTDAPILDTQRFFADDLLFEDSEPGKRTVRHSWEISEPTAMVYLQNGPLEDQGHFH